ncbi:hypothetical protein T11_6905 [Trichinella zimbabwensis]|uniref:Uncharacterized protein n=1 Tax=Trichinella zimbabwensis TaxID=268475 RepID=A0A0V1HSW6_9BILA|nr:hypothetical protein T11_6905 [Trichinella zimbabwensis]
MIVKLTCKVFLCSKPSKFAFFKLSFDFADLLCAPALLSSSCCIVRNSGNVEKFSDEDNS